MRVLVCSTNRVAAGKIASLLENDSTIVDAVERLDQVFAPKPCPDHDVIVLDMTEAEPETYNFVRRARRNGIFTPVLVLATCDEANLRIEAFRSGADGYIAKPFEPKELVAQVRSAMRRTNGHSQAVLRVGKLEIDTDEQKVFAGGVSIDLTEKEYTTLEVLILRQGRIVERGVLLGHLYSNDDEPYEKIVDVFVCRLRKKLVGAGLGNLISTVRGRGYIVRKTAERPGGCLQESCKAA